MPFVVTENCIKCKYTDCVEVCPVDCFHEGPNFLVIDPDECIDCTLCEPECPINAIYPEDDVPAGQEQFVALNAELSKQRAQNVANALAVAGVDPSRVDLQKPALANGGDEAAARRVEVTVN